MTRTLTAVFEDRRDAERAADQLEGVGIVRTAIRILPERDAAFERKRAAHDAGMDKKSFWESMAGFFFPDEHRHRYSEALNRGGNMLVVVVDDAMAGEAKDILEEYGPVDTGGKEQTWRKEGWAG